MALNIKDRETERLAAEIAAMTGESKTKAVRTALLERKPGDQPPSARPTRTKSRGRGAPAR